MSESKNQLAEAVAAPAATSVEAPAPGTAPATPGAAPVAVKPPQPETHRLVVGTSPHLHAKESVPEIMRWVVIALVPAVLVSLWFFGFEALRVYVLATGLCMLAEWVCLKKLKTPGSLGDWSAALTGILLAMNLPPTAPWWMIAVGSVVAIVIAKHLFGGLGSNIFNPALTARVFLLISWPVQMTTWLKPYQRGWISPGADLAAITEATPLELVKQGRGADLASRAGDLLMGNIGGSLGEISAIALIIGGVILLIRKIITWEIPVLFIGSALAVAGGAWLADPVKYASPLTHLLAGGLLLGAIFMATDMVTSPNTFRGRVIFAIGGGLLTGIIRLWGSYPEGVSFAILLMNGVAPLIDHYVRPRPFGAGAAAKPGVAT